MEGAVELPRTGCLTLYRLRLNSATCVSGGQTPLLFRP